MKTIEMCLEVIKNRKKGFLTYDIDFNESYSKEFLNFYCSFMIWNMGHARLEHDFDIIKSLNQTEKEIALKLVEENFKNISLIESFLFALNYFKNKKEVEEFIKRQLVECVDGLFFHSYINILRSLKEQRVEIDIDFDEAIKVVMEKGNSEEIINLLWSCETLVGRKRFEIYKYYKNSENIKIRETVQEILHFYDYTE